MINMKKIIYSLVIIFTVSLITTSCKKEFLETYPTDAISSTAVTETTDNAWAALNGIHRALYVRYQDQQGNGGLGSFYIVVDCMAEDHVVNSEQWYGEVYKWNSYRNPTNRYNRFPWLMFYQWIANANILINSVDDATGPNEDKQVIKGQALLYRAFSHYEIVQLYGERYRPGGGNSQLGVPYMKGVNPDGEPRNTVEEVYTEIHADIDAAIALLDGMPRKNKSHLNVDVARGLKARVYLTQGNYAQAAQWASNARTMAQGSYSLMDSVTYFNGFRIESQSEGEYIWASHIVDDQNDKWASYGAYISRNFSSSAIRGNPRSINSVLYNQISPTDVRSLNYSVDGLHDNLPAGISLLSSHSRHPYTNQKFIAVSSGDSRVDVPHMRLSELYLIEAEALARQGGNDAAAAAALFPMAKARDAFYTLSTNTGQVLIDEIMIQRRVELWGEGFRWFDLKRLNEDLVRAGNHDPALADNVMFVAAGDVDWVWLIPQAEIDANENMVQNPL